MIRTLLSGIMLFAVCSPGLAQQAEAVATSQLSDSNIFHWIITVFGTLWAARLASRAFNRPSVPLADVPTFPMYMTSSNPISVGQFDLHYLRLQFFLGPRSLAPRGRWDIRLASTTCDDIQANAPSDKRAVRVLFGRRKRYGCPLPVFADQRNRVEPIVDDSRYDPALDQHSQLAGRIVAQIRFSLSVPKEAVANVACTRFG